MNTPLSIFAVATLTLTSAMHSFAVPQNPEFTIHTPDTTGIPGQGTVMFARFAPTGHLWVSANTAGQIWLYGGIGILEPSSAPSGNWTTHSSRNTPLQFWNYQVEWDSSSAAWIACENLLVKYDGNDWTFFDPNNSPLVGDRNWDVAIDPTTDHVWVANADIDQVQGGLFEYNPVTHQWTHHDEPFMRTYFGISKPISVFVRNNGQVWATFDFMSGNARRDPASGVWTHQTWPRLLEFAENSHGVLHATGGADTPGVFQYDDASQTWTQIGPWSSSVIAFDDQDRMYIGNGTTVHRHAERVWGVFAVGPSEVKSIEFDPAPASAPGSSDVWICYKHSVRQYTADGTGKHIYSSVITGIGDYLINNIEIDREGNLWTMTGQTGATRFDGERYRNFSQYGHEEVNPFQVGSQLLCTHVADVFHDSAGSIWFAANGVTRASAESDLAEWTIWSPMNSNLPFGGLRAIGEDANGDIWAGSDGAGIYRFNAASESWEYRELGPNFDSQRVREIVTASDGVMWVATYAGVHRFDGVSWTYIPGFSAQIPSMPLDLAAGLNGEVWIATGNGLVRHDGTNFEVYGPWNSPFMHGRISCVAVRGDGLVAACSDSLINWPYSGDLCFFDGKQWSQFPGGYGNPNPFYQSNAMEFDSKGDLWVAQINYGAVQVVIDPIPLPVPGDITGDGLVNVNDLLAVINAWGACGPPCPADIAPTPDGDGVVNVNDLLMVINNWG